MRRRERGVACFIMRPTWLRSMAKLELRPSASVSSE